MADEAPTSHIDHALKNTRSGIPFQYAVLRYCQELFQTGGSRWVFEVAEFPVNANGTDTRIDFVLHGQAHWKAQGAYLVCECKRPNPALSDWAFLRSGYWRRDRETRVAAFEGVRVEPTTGRLASAPQRLFGPNEPYDIPLELKGPGKGDEKSSGRGAIEEAATQVSRGVGGLIEFFKQRPKSLNGPALVVPVIFTTARLHVSDVDVGATDLRTGTLPADVQTTESHWLWFQYHLSSTLRHTVPTDPRDAPLRSLGSVLESEHSRSIAVVSSTGIEMFLKHMFESLDATDALTP